MHLSDFDYDLPPALIAQHPAVERAASRLLQLTDAGVEHRVFGDVVDLLAPNDVLVVNNTRVIKARLFGVKDTGGGAELLLERLLEEHQGLFQVRVSKPLKPGRVVRVGDHELYCVERLGQFYQLRCDVPLLDVMETHGHVPLPPYIERDDSSVDDERYQTVYSHVPGAVAAPTAGLHFSEALLAAIRAKGVGIAEVTLHVGAGTFQPVRGDLERHEMHCEFYEVSEKAVAEIARAQSAGGRVVAVGTTVVRTLESAVLAQGGQLRAAAGETRLFIKPGFEFGVVDALITNFHLPESTLLMLVCAFAGYDRVMAAYRKAVAEQYRFFSYGDAMWLERGPGFEMEKQSV